MPTVDAVLVDTHVLLWWQAGGERLSRRAAARIDGADVVYVSPISCWEIAVLVTKEGHCLEQLVRVRPDLGQDAVLVGEHGVDAALHALAQCGGIERAGDHVLLQIVGGTGRLTRCW